MVIVRAIRLTFFLAMVCLVTSVFSQDGSAGKTIGRIRFEGNRNIEDEALFDVTGLRTGDIFQEGMVDSAVQHILLHYHRNGFYLAGIDSVVENAIDTIAFELTFWLEEGERTRLGRLYIHGLPESMDEKDIRLESRVGGEYIEVLVEEDIDHILTVLENSGYPLSSVHVDSVDFRIDESRPLVDLVLRVDPGPMVHIGSLRSSGNSITKERIVVRETRLKPGDVYRHDDVHAAMEKLRKLEYFDEVGEPQVSFIKDEAVITFPIKDGNANTLDGVVGYTPPPSEDREGYVTGRLEFTFRNLFGTGRFLEAYWEKKDEHSQSMRFGYEEPWVLGKPLWIGGRFKQDVRDSTYVERAWMFSARLVPWSTFSMHIEGGQREVLPDSTGSRLLNIAQTSTWFVSAGIDYNTLDDPLNPTRGVRYLTTITLGRKRNLGPDFLTDDERWKERVETRRIEVDAEAVISVFRRQAVYLGLHGVEVKTGDDFVPVSDQVRFGGAKTLRGYEEDIFRGSLAAWGNLEYRYLLGRRSRVFIFLDGGMYQRREESGLIRETKIGYGFGIRLDTALGLFGVDFGMGEGDSFLQAKVHVGLVSRF